MNHISFVLLQTFLPISTHDDYLYFYTTLKSRSPTARAAKWFLGSHHPTGRYNNEALVTHHYHLIPC